jgi:hypothetical protein
MICVVRSYFRAYGFGFRGDRGSVEGVGCDAWRHSGQYGVLTQPRDYRGYISFQILQLA